MFPDNCQVAGATQADIGMYLFTLDYPAEARSKLPLINKIPCVVSAGDARESKVVRHFIATVTTPAAGAILAQPHVTYEELYRDSEIEVDNSFFKESRRQS